MRLAVIGTGKMGQAIVSGLLSHQLFAASDITGVSKTETSRDTFLQLDPAGQLRWTPSIAEAIQEADVILLGVKPFQMAEILPLVKTASSRSLFISIAAGLKLSSYESILGAEARIIRAMPNTPVTVGSGVTGYTPNSNCLETDLETVSEIFCSVGDSFQVEESQLDAITALSGSGPAFVYRIIEAMAAGAVKEGLDPAQALTIASLTVIGAARMIQETGKTPDVLVSQVVSKGGTTEAGLKVLENSAFGQILSETLQAAATRSRELSGS